VDFDTLKDNMCTTEIVASILELQGDRGDLVCFAGGCLYLGA
jgi:hypothetical protein